MVYYRFQIQRTIKISKKVRVNGQIIAPKVRLIDAEGGQLGVVPLLEALNAARQAQLDLVEISPTAEPPVCRVMDYGKFVFEQRKKQAVARKKQKQVQVKELKYRPTTEEGDYQVKMRSLLRFLSEGDKVKITVRFRGREVMHQDLGVEIMRRLEVDTAPYGIVEQHAKLEGRQMVMIIGPKKAP